jgi:hypothetical protein
MCLAFNMILSTRKIWIINIVVSAILLSVLLFFFYDIAISISSFPDSFNRPLGNFSLSIFSTVVLGLIPVWAYFLYSSLTTISFRHVIWANLATVVSVVMTCIFAFILCATMWKSNSQLIPDYIVFVPYPRVFWTVIFIVGVIIPHLIKRVLQRSLR